MQTNNSIFFKLFYSIAGLTLASAMNTATAADLAVEVKFAAVVNGEAFECGKSYSNIGTTKSGSAVTVMVVFLAVSNGLIITNASSSAGGV